MDAFYPTFPPSPPSLLLFSALETCLLSYLCHNDTRFFPFNLFHCSH